MKTPKCSLAINAAFIGPRFHLQFNYYDIWHAKVQKYTLVSDTGLLIDTNTRRVAIWVSMTS